jgi:2-methylisocitrate lyase-like PEP mutase family enzyme
MKAARRLRELLAEDAIILAPGCHDALGAYFIQKAGFKTAYLTGYGAACSLLGRPDLGELTMTEIVDHAARIATAIEIPLICDADTGYGGPLNVQRTVQEFQKAGVAAIHIEDQVEPKRCAAMKGIAVTDLDTAVKKIRAALSAKEDPDFIIIARTDSRPLLGLDHAVERARAFAEAGADMVYVELLRSKEEVAFVAESVKEASLLFDSFDHPDVPALSAFELEEMGYRIVTYPFTSTLAYAKMLDQIYSGIFAEKDAQHLASLRMNFHDFEKIMALEEIWRKVDAL